MSGPTPEGGQVPGGGQRGEKFVNNSAGDTKKLMKMIARLTRSQELITREQEIAINHARERVSWPWKKVLN